MTIDINCDMGESYGTFPIGNDDALLALVSSANIACGFHGGDPGTMHRTVIAAKRQAVAIGAHPSYPDLQGFGRRDMSLSDQEVYDDMLYQLGALEAFTRSVGTKLHHVKPHGALYNRAAKDPALAAAICNAVFYFDRHLQVYGLPDSELEKAALNIGLSFCREAFADRAYREDGSLVPRSQAGAVFKDVAQAVQQVLQIVTMGKVTTAAGSMLPLRAETICIHGDGPLAAEMAAAIRQALTEKEILVQAPAPRP